MSGIEQSQKSVFLAGEGDAYFERNREKGAERDEVDDLLTRYLHGATSVLEVGCAEGHRLRKLRESLGVVELAGVDPSASAIEWGRANFDLDLRVGTADEIGFDGEFDAVLLGFCLYLCDPVLLPKIVAEVDQRVADHGSLLISDFDPPAVRRRRYQHHAGVWSYKMDFPSMFLCFPQYQLAAKHPFGYGTGQAWNPAEGDRWALWVLKKRLDTGFFEEVDASS